MITRLEPPPEPSEKISDPGQLLVAFLDFYRETVPRKVHGLTEDEMRTSRVPSGWTPLQLVKHLAHVERRWFRWGFTAENVDSPWGDFGADATASADAWLVEPGETLESVLALYADECARSRAIIAATPLDTLATVGLGFEPEDELPTLGWIVAHVLQEYARHTGHLDVARELADGVIGE